MAEPLLLASAVTLTAIATPLTGMSATTTPPNEKEHTPPALEAEDEIDEGEEEGAPDGPAAGR